MLLIRYLNLFLKTPRALDFLVILLGLGYPFFVLVGLKFVPEFVIGLMLIILLVARFLSKPITSNSQIERGVFVFGLAAISGLLLVNDLLALKAYPVIVSCGLAFIFAHSLIRPPNVIEKLARLTEPNLNELAVRYTRKVAMIWIMFFVFNACISVGTSIWGDLRSWALYNGFLSYVLIGLLFVSEFIVRQFAKKRHHEEI